MSQLLQGRYRREAVLGHWDAATTTLALDTQTGQLCVVKALRLPREAAPDLVKLLKREARAYQQLAHPRIPKLLEAFAKEEDGLTSFYLVQEHVAGRDLARVVREDGPFLEAQALALLQALLDLLDRFHTHAPPLTHRAVKPQNVLIGESGQPHLIDFGSWSGAMRRLLGPEGQLAPSDGRGYSAPEQLAGRPVAASDVFSLGATLLFALTRRDPSEIDGGGAQAALSDLPVSRRLRRILLGMLEPSVESRYANARQVLAALQPAAPSAPVSSRALAGGAAALALAGVVLFSWPRAPRSIAPVPVEAKPLPPRPQPTAIPPRPKAAGAPMALIPRPTTDDVTPVSARLGVLSLDVYRDFKYIAQGFPGNLSVGQTDASALDWRSQETLSAEPRYASPRPLYGYLTLGNGPDRRITFVLDQLEQPTWVAWVDRNNNEDLTDDGPPLPNQGTGFMAATVRLFIDVNTRDSGLVRRPYQLWLWVNPWKDAPEGTPALVARFYSICHYAGRLALGDEVFQAVAFERQGHDGLLDQDGIWVDLDRDGTFAPEEHFDDGAQLSRGNDSVRLRLRPR